MSVGCSPAQHLPSSRELAARVMSACSAAARHLPSCSTLLPNVMPAGCSQRDTFQLQFNAKPRVFARRLQGRKTRSKLRGLVAKATARRLFGGAQVPAQGHVCWLFSSATPSKLGLKCRVCGLRAAPPAKLWSHLSPSAMSAGCSHRDTSSSGSTHAKGLRLQPAALLNTFQAPRNPSQRLCLRAVRQHATLQAFFDLAANRHATFQLWLGSELGKNSPSKVVSAGCAAACHLPSSLHPRSDVMSAATTQCVTLQLR